MTKLKPVNETKKVVTEARLLLDKLLEKQACLKIDNIYVNKAWQESTGKEMPNTFKEKPEKKFLLDLGKKLDADYVIFGRTHWSTKQVFVTWRTIQKAYATTDAIVINVNKSEVLSEKSAYYDSENKNNDTAKVVASGAS